MKILINLICLLIPSKQKRKEIRKKLITKYEKKQLKKDYTKNKLRQISIKMSMPDDVYQFNNIKMYVPDYPLDYIQETIVDENDFYEKDFLIYLDNFVKPNDCILEIGANIGNHTVYWGKMRNAQHIYCFEPIAKTFKRLQKNIEINNLQSKTTLFNKAAGKENTAGVIDSFNMSNIGATSIKSSKEGDLEIVRIDDMKFNHKIDFVKIDVEGFEVDVLEGMVELLKQDKPNVVIESFKENAPKIIEIMTSIGYKSLGDSFHKDNYLFIME
tara:strand:+ start:1463 stop:2275 length:813 start_codon:yes stop_codon:yes gene_type:complete